MANWFADAGLDINELSDNPYEAFGNSHWTLYVTEARMPKASQKGAFGMYCKFQIVEERWQNVKEFGRWIQLPTPKQVQDEYGTTFDPKENPRDAEVAAFLIKWLMSLGFGMDEIASENGVTHEMIQGRAFLAQMRARENDEGYYEFFWRNPKPLPEEGTDEGLNEFKSNSSVADIEAALKSDMDNA